MTQHPHIRDLTRDEMHLYHLVQSDTRTFVVSTGHEGQLYLDETHTPKWATFSLPDEVTDRDGWSA